MLDVLSIAALAASSLLLIGWGISERSRVLQFPFFVGLVFAGWVLPQLIGLTHDPFLPEGGLAKTGFFGAACALATLLGYRAGGKPISGLTWELDNQLMFVVAIVLMIVGGYFFALVRMGAAAATEEYSGQWTGAITIYYFFSRLMGFGLILAVVGYLQHPSKGWFALILVGAVSCLVRIVNFGRRAELVELAIIVLLMAWFHKRVVPHRLLMILGAGFVVLVVNGIGTYRSIVEDEEGMHLSELSHLDLMASFSDVLEEGGEEMRNAVYTIEGTARSMDFDWGLSIWNSLVFQYVPAQIVGVERKEALLIPFDDSAYMEFGHVPYTGSTPTGLSDSFASFGYLGWIKFLVIGYAMGRLWATARQGRQAAQILLLVLVTPGIQIVTHSTNWLIKDLPQVILLLLLPLYYARKKSLPIAGAMLHRLG